MNFRLVKFNLGPGKLDAAKAIFADLEPLIKAQPGYKGIMKFGDEAFGVYGFSVLCESAEASKNATQIIGPRLSKHLADNNTSDNPFSSELFEVFE